jgi:hypothetical protein
LGKYGAMVKVHWMQSLYRHAGALPLLEQGVFYRRWTAEVREERRMDVQPPILGMTQDARRHEQTKGHGDDKVEGCGWGPACEGVGDMGIELELFGGYALDGHCGPSVETCQSGATWLPSVLIFRPRPVRFAGRCSTSMECMRPGLVRFASASPRRDAMLKWSDPQNRMRSGSEAQLGGTELCRRHDDSVKERTEAGRRQSWQSMRRDMSWGS